MGVCADLVRWGVSEGSLWVTAGGHVLFGIRSGSTWHPHWKHSECVSAAHVHCSICHLPQVYGKSRCSFAQHVSIVVSPVNKSRRSARSHLRPYQLASCSLTSYLASENPGTAQPLLAEISAVTPPHLDHCGHIQSQGCDNLKQWVELSQSLWTLPAIRHSKW